MKKFSLAFASGISYMITMDYIVTNASIFRIGLAFFTCLLCAYLYKIEEINE